MFETCDIFNRALHDRSWPRLRGGKGITGDMGCRHDFLMACVMQNARNAWLALGETGPSSHSFEEAMKDIATPLTFERSFYWYNFCLNWISSFRDTLFFAIVRVKCP